MGSIMVVPLNDKINGWIFCESDNEMYALSYNECIDYIPRLHDNVLFEPSR